MDQAPHGNASIVSIFENNYYGPFNVAICHFIRASMPCWYICPNIGILAVFSIFPLDYRFKVKTVLLNSIKSTQLNTIDFN